MNFAFPYGDSIIASCLMLKQWVLWDRETFLLCICTALSTARCCSVTRALDPTTMHIIINPNRPNYLLLLLVTLKPGNRINMGFPRNLFSPPSYQSISAQLNFFLNGFKYVNIHFSSDTTKEE